MNEFRHLKSRWAIVPVGFFLNFALFFGGGCLEPSNISPHSACAAIATVKEHNIKTCSSTTKTYPTLIHGCQDSSAENATGLLVTTTDLFAAGSAAYIATANSTTNETIVIDDIVVGSTDAIPVWLPSAPVILNRHGFNTLDQLDAQTMRLSQQRVISSAFSANPNPQSISENSMGYFIANLDSPLLLEWSDLINKVGTPTRSEEFISFANDADADCNADIGHLISCQDITLAFAQRLDATYQRVPPDRLIIIDHDCMRPYTQSIDLLSGSVSQVRVAPLSISENRSIIFALSTGLERIDLNAATGERVSWALSESVFSSHGFSAWNLTAFAIDPLSQQAYFAISRQDFSGIDIWQAETNGDLTNNDASLHKVIDGGRDPVHLNAIERTLEIIGNRLYFGSNAPGHEGVYIYKLTDLQQGQEPENVLPEQIISLSLPPYSLVGVIK